MSIEFGFPGSRDGTCFWSDAPDVAAGALRNESWIL
jgi:hypothetical protein